MTTNYIAIAPGTTFPTVTLQAYDASGNIVAGNLSVPALKDMTMNNSNDIFSWTQMNESGKLQIATTSTNSLATNLVLEAATYFGTSGVGTGTTALAMGIQGLSTAKTKCRMSVSNVVGKTVTADCYITGLAPTVSADSPVWVSPVTFTVTGSFTFA
jgi:hypothetical protein